MLQRVGIVLLIGLAALVVFGYLPNTEAVQAKEKAVNIINQVWTASEDATIYDNGSVLVRMRNANSTEELLVPSGHHFSADFKAMKKDAQLKFISCSCGSGRNIAAMYLAPDTPNVQKVLKARGEFWH